MILGDLLDLTMSKMYSDAREARKQVFLDTKQNYESNDTLITAVKSSIERQRVVLESDKVESANNEKRYNTPATIVISKKRSLEAAKAYKDFKVCVHNFASATNPGGGVENGSSAQEEAICRCSTLFPCISTSEIRASFHNYHRSMLKNGMMDVLYNDDCIYTPDVVVLKTDTNNPQLMPEEEWYKVDVVSCAAPNLRNNPSNTMNPGSGDKRVVIKANDLMNLHMKRMRRILDLAKTNGAEVMILGAFGCGAFQNSPDVVAEAMARLIPEYRNDFKVIEFAVYCPPSDTKNYDVFSRRLAQFIK